MTYVFAFTKFTFISNGQGDDDNEDFTKILKNLVKTPIIRLEPLGLEKCQKMGLPGSRTSD